MKTPIEKKQPKEEVDDDVEEDAMAEQIVVDVEADFEPPTEKKKYKVFEMIKLDTFQVIRMCLTPRFMYTYY